MPLRHQTNSALELTGLLRTLANQCVVENQHDDRADHGNYHAVDVEAGHTCGAERREERTAHYGADDADHDIQNDALAFPIDDFARDKACDET